MRNIYKRSLREYFSFLFTRHFVDRVCEGESTSIGEDGSEGVRVGEDVNVGEGQIESAGVGMLRVWI